MVETSVPLSEIRTWFNATFDALERRGETHLDMSNKDFYWTFGAEASFDLTRTQRAGTGSLYDDVLDIRRDIASSLDERATFAWHTLEHLGGVVLALSAQVSSYKALPELNSKTEEGETDA
ncbi:hypothetical protein AADZ90_009585 [Aestuariibius sp. 2305UL40-4]|uniref:hypothetical protein n=1 Tax=Aestuariibius violaceus TaxID=3234132 RepID=UPI00345E5B9A